VNAFHEQQEDTHQYRNLGCQGVIQELDLDIDRLHMHTKRFVSAVVDRVWKVAYIEMDTDGGLHEA
jgi:hypothetical protein